MQNIIVVAGAYPDVGKGIFSSSVGYIFKTHSHKVQMLKFDGFFNYSNGTMNPYHENMELVYSEEEVFTLADGYEADVDSGNYERFLHKNYLFNGHINNAILFDAICKQKTLGETVNYRSIRNNLKKMILNPEFKSSDVLIIEVGGSVGDKESEIFYECLNLIKQKNEARIFTILLSPYFEKSSFERTELSYRTKIIRQAYEKMWRLGVAPDAIVLRTNKKTVLLEIDLEYIELETDLTPDKIFVNPDVDNIYELPKILRNQKIYNEICSGLKLTPETQIKDDHIEKYYEKLINNQQKKKTKIAVFGKNMACDSYVSLIEALNHSSVNNNLNIEIDWLDDSHNWKEKLSEAKGLIIGEGLTNIDEKIESIKYAYNKKTPILAISFGFIILMKAMFKIIANKELHIEELGDIPSDLYIRKSDLKTGVFKLKDGTYSNERLRIKSIPNKNIDNHLREVGFEVVMQDKDENVMSVEFVKSQFCVGTLSHPEYLSHPMYPHPLIEKFIIEAKN